MALICIALRYNRFNRNALHDFKLQIKLHFGEMRNVLPLERDPKSPVS